MEGQEYLEGEAGAIWRAERNPVCPALLIYLCSAFLCLSGLPSFYLFTTLLRRDKTDKRDKEKGKENERQRKGVSTTERKRAREREREKKRESAGTK